MSLCHPKACRDLQDIPAAAFCQRCGGEIYPLETAYRYEERWLCPDCFGEEIRRLLAEAPHTLALALGLDFRVCARGGRGPHEAGARGGRRPDGP